MNVWLYFQNSAGLSLITFSSPVIVPGPTGYTGATGATGSPGDGALYVSSTSSSATYYPIISSTPSASPQTTANTSANFTVNPSNGCVELIGSQGSAQNVTDIDLKDNLVLVSTKAGSSQYSTRYSMGLGVDYSTGYGYIGAAGNSSYQPILINPRGGNVGINITNPQYPLDVGGKMNISSSESQLQITDGSSSFILANGINSQLSNSNFGILGSGKPYGSNLPFVITSTGIVAINYTNNTWDNFGNVLQVAGGITAGVVSAIIYYATSDYRIKENVETLDSRYTTDNLRPVTYINKLSGNRDIGLIAHELQEFYPELVTGEKDGPENQTINYNGLIGILINDIKELKEEIKELKEENKDIKKLLNI